MRMITLFIFLFSLCATASGNVFEDIAKLPKTSKARIKSGARELTVDLAQKPQIRDYDVIYLDEGVYSTLGNSSAKYVRYIGKGRGKTIISNGGKGFAPILVNSSEFWDVTFADAQFKLVDVSGLWAVNTEFIGALLVKPASEDKAPGFRVRSIFSDVQNEDAQFTNLKLDSQTPAGLLAYEDTLDRTEKMNPKERMAHKGLIARAANYLSQIKNLKTPYNPAKFRELARRARAAKAKGHLYVSMLTWAEADRLAGHSRFDEVIREITPLQQRVNMECGCSVEGEGLAAAAKKDIEEKLYAKIPAASLPGPCKIQALYVKPSATTNLETAIASARSEAQLAKMAAFRAGEDSFIASVVAHSGASAASDDEFAVGAEAMKDTKATPAKEYTAAADVDMPGFRKTLAGKNDSIDSAIVEPIDEAYKKQFAEKIAKADKQKKSPDLFEKLEGYLVAKLFASDKQKQDSYEELHEQQFGRKLAGDAAISSVYSY